jgi:hypothetical protein
MKRLVSTRIENGKVTFPGRQYRESVSALRQSRATSNRKTSQGLAVKVREAIKSARSAVRHARKRAEVKDDAR